MVTPGRKSREQIEAEAAAWLCRLDSDDRSPKTEAGFQEWLNADPAHQQVFQDYSEVWQMMPGAMTASRSRAPGSRPRAANANKPWAPAFAAAAALILTIAAGGLWWTSRPQVYETKVGHQQVMTLSDGSRVSLNTDSKIAVSYSGKQRRIELIRGEAMFDVAHNARRPFLVLADQERVRALGTSFTVRREADQVSVILVKGSVELSKSGGDGFEPQVIMVAGERATVDGAGRVTVDTPVVSEVTAWRRGEVVFNEATILEAANELNRYNTTKIVVTDPTVARTRVTGIFESNDPREFAAAVAQLNKVRIRRSGQDIELTR